MLVQGLFSLMCIFTNRGLRTATDSGPLPPHPSSLLCPFIFTKVSDCVSIAGLQIGSSVHREQTYGHRDEE